MFKNTVILVAIYLTFISCSVNKTGSKSHVYFNKNCFYNDSLKVVIDFGGGLDFKYYARPNEYKGLLKIHQNSGITAPFLIAKSKENGYVIYFFFKKSETSGDNFTVDSTLNNVTFFEKQRGLKGVIGIVKSTSKIDSLSSVSIAKKLTYKIQIDSLNPRKMSYLSVYRNYFSRTHPNNLFANKKILSAPFKTQRENNIKFQYLSTVNSFMSNNKLYDSLIVGYEKQRKQEFNSLIDDLSSKEGVYKNSAVFNRLSVVAKENRVVMLNEDHYYPKHRLFAMQLLETLKVNGYKYISLEAFVSSSGIDYTPNHNNGIYTSEPYFAHFIRKAKELGFTVLGHENYDSGIEREIGQAKNILKILEKDPEAKIFIYVGHSHIEKIDSKKKWMAEYFKELSGINPITINQTVICADTNEDLILVPRKYLTDTTKITSSADYFLVNNLKPSLKMIYPNAEFKKAIIKERKFSDYKKKEVLVEIVDFKEFDLMKNLAIPIKSFLITPKNETINFELPIGKYHIFVKTDIDSTIYDDDKIVN